MDEILKALEADEVISFDSRQALNDFYDYLVEREIDPDDFRRQGLDVWKA